MQSRNNTYDKNNGVYKEPRRCVSCRMPVESQGKGMMMMDVTYRCDQGRSDYSDQETGLLCDIVLEVLSR